MQKTNVAILGTGTLGTDLLIKVMRSQKLLCTAFLGRSRDSKGIAFARNSGIFSSEEGIDYILQNPGLCDVVFDVTNANSHLAHCPLLKSLEKTVIDLTPSHAGYMVVPAINLKEGLSKLNISLISCGGQASLPMIHAIAKLCQNVTSIEVVSLIASRSAGPGTRINIDQYIEKTEAAIRFFTSCPDVKTILILNPAVPEVNMKTTIYVKAECNDLGALKRELQLVEQNVQSYAPGYKIILGPTMDHGAIVLSVMVQGIGDFLPIFAGNLDIINCAAIQIAEAIATNAQKKAETLYESS